MEANLFMNLSRNLREIRTSFGLTQETVADYVGISVRSYQRYEKDSTGISVEVLANIASLYGIPIDDLTNGQMNYENFLDKEIVMNSFIKAKSTYICRKLKYYPTYDDINIFIHNLELDRAGSGYDGLFRELLINNAIAKSFETYIKKNEPTIEKREFIFKYFLVISFSEPDIITKKRYKKYLDTDLAFRIYQTCLVSLKNEYIKLLEMIK